MIIPYNSISAVRQAYIDNFGLHSHDSYGGGSWVGNETVADSLRYAETGDTRLVPEAEKLLDKLDFAIETPRRVWERSPAGVFAVVPEVIAGLPTPMRRQVLSFEDIAPITVLVDMGSSAAISADTMRKRGVAILALVLALSRARPVSLSYLDCGSGITDGETVVTAHINTSPLDLATSCYVLTSAGFTRQIVYKLEEKLNGFSGGWPKDYNYFNSETSSSYYDRLKVKLGLEPEKSLIIGAAKANDTLVTNPIPWIQRQVDYFISRNQDEMNYA